MPMLSSKGKRTRRKSCIETLQCFDATPRDARSGLLAHQAQEADLRRRTQPLGRAPVSGAAARVDPQVLQPVQSGRKRLEPLDEQVPREKLSAMRVARQL